MIIERARLEAAVEAVFEAHGAARAQSRPTARALVAAEIDGQRGHGLSRVAAYAAQVAAGKVDGQASPVIEAELPGLIRIDAAHGFAFPALDLAIARLPDMARAQGIAAAYLRCSHHAGQLGGVVERLAEAGVLALMVANTPRAMAPWGGQSAIYGTNPIAFAAPRKDRPPLVIDLSLSRVARGKVMAADARGEPIPQGWALDRDGQPTTDAKAALEGTMIPAGEAKGAALALMVEVLAATLTGAVASRAATSFFDAEGAPPGVGQTIVALAPERGFDAALEGLIAAIEADGARLPGTSRLKARADAAQGVEIRDEDWAMLERLGRGPAG